METERIEITQAQFDHLRNVKLRNHKYWPAVFSTNCHEDIWLYVTDGYTPREFRKDVRGSYRLIDMIGDAMLRARPEGGRFFIDETGAFYKNVQGHSVRFVWFQYRN